MKKCDLLQNDMVSKNVCVNKDGIITVIDYDLAKVSNIKDDEYKKLKTQLTNIIEKNKYLILD